MSHLPTQVQGFSDCHYWNTCLGDVSGLLRSHGVIGYLPQTHSPSSPRVACPVAMNKRIPHLYYTHPNPWYSSRLSSNSFSPIKPSLLQLLFTIPTSLKCNSIDHLHQWYPTFLVLGTSFMEDNFFQQAWCRE